METSPITAREHAQKIHSLRNDWQVAKRYEFPDPPLRTDCAGWNDALEYLQAKLSSKSGVTIALVGNRGNGKTQLAVELMRTRTEELRAAIYITAMEFFMAMKETYRKDSEETESGMLMRFRIPSLLVIDEFGKRGESQWESNMLFELLNRRYGSRKDTILICNQGKADFDEMIGPSIASRMNDGGGIIECNWPSFREGVPA